MERLIYVLVGFLGGVISGFLSGVWATNKSRDREKWDAIRTGQFLYDDRIYDVRLRRKETLK